jgi:predicted Zn-dependent protease with MMP-like domain
MRKLAKVAAWIVLGLIVAALLAAAAFELVTGDGTPWARVPAALVLLAFAGVLGFVATRSDGGGQPPAEAKPEAKPEGIGFAGVSDPELEQLVTQAVDGLPAEFRNQITNLAFVIEDEPPPGKSWLAVYQGIPLTQKSSLTGWPDKITIFRGPLRRLYGADPQVFAQEVAHVVRHELAHYFGISDARLVELGAY